MQKRLIFILFIVIAITISLGYFSFGDMMAKYNAGSTLKNDVNPVADVNLATGELSLSFPFMAYGARAGLSMQPILYYNGGKSTSSSCASQFGGCSIQKAEPYSYVGAGWTLTYGSISYDRNHNKYRLNLPDGTSGEMIPVGNQDQMITTWQLRDNPFYNITRYADYGSYIQKTNKSYDKYYNVFLGDYISDSSNYGFKYDYWVVLSPSNKEYTFNHLRYYRNVKSNCVELITGVRLFSCSPRIVYQWDITEEKGIDALRRSRLIYSYNDGVASTSSGSDFRQKWLTSAYTFEGYPGLNPMDFISDIFATSYITDSYLAGIRTDKPYGNEIRFTSRRISNEISQVYSKNYLPAFNRTSTAWTAFSIPASLFSYPSYESIYCTPPSACSNAYNEGLRENEVSVQNYVSTFENYYFNYPSDKQSCLTKLNGLYTPYNCQEILRLDSKSVWDLMPFTYENGNRAGTVSFEPRTYYFYTQLKDLKPETEYVFKAKVRSAFSPTSGGACTTDYLRAYSALAFKSIPYQLLNQPGSAGYDVLGGYNPAIEKCLDGFYPNAELASCMSSSSFSPNDVNDLDWHDLIGMPNFECVLSGQQCHVYGSIHDYDVLKNPDIYYFRARTPEKWKECEFPGPAFSKEGYPLDQDYNVEFVFKTDDWNCGPNCFYSQLNKTVNSTFVIAAYAQGGMNLILYNMSVMESTFSSTGGVPQVLDGIEYASMDEGVFASYKFNYTYKEYTPEEPIPYLTSITKIGKDCKEQMPSTKFEYVSIGTGYDRHDQISKIIYPLGGYTTFRYSNNVTKTWTEIFPEPKNFGVPYSTFYKKTNDRVGDKRDYDFDNKLISTTSYDYGTFSWNDEKEAFFVNKATVTNSLGEKIETSFINEGAPTNLFGKETQTKVFDSNNNLITQTNYVWVNQDLGSNTRHARLTETNTTQYASGTSKTTKTTYSNFDTINCDLAKTVNSLGFIDNSNDDYSEENTYLDLTSSGRYIKCLLDETTIKKGGTVYAKEKNYYNNYGQLIKKESIDPANAANKITVNFEYDLYGNVIKQNDSLGNSKTFIYDPYTFESFPSQVTNSVYGLETKKATTTFGLVAAEWDANNKNDAATFYQFDSLFRLSKGKVGNTSITAKEWSKGTSCAVSRYPDFCFTGVPRNTCMGVIIPISDDRRMTALPILGFSIKNFLFRITGLPVFNPAKTNKTEQTISKSQIRPRIMINEESIGIGIVSDQNGLYCNEYAQIISNCSGCGCMSGWTCDRNTERCIDLNICSDGTSVNGCNSKGERCKKIGGISTLSLDCNCKGCPKKVTCNNGTTYLSFTGAAISNNNNLNKLLFDGGGGACSGALPWDCRTEWGTNCNGNYACVGLSGDCAKIEAGNVTLAGATGTGYPYKIYHSYYPNGTEYFGDIRGCKAHRVGDINCNYVLQKVDPHCQEVIPPQDVICYTPVAGTCDKFTGKCSYPCVIDSDCGGRLSCISGLCKPYGTCISNSDCESGECIRGHCSVVLDER